MEEDLQIFFKMLLVQSRDESMKKNEMSLNRMKFPTFSGKNPNSWLLMANKMFEYYWIPVWY
jgi:hypothetical protein